jgi:hypothetical protein
VGVKLVVFQVELVDFLVSISVAGDNLDSAFPVAPEARVDSLPVTLKASLRACLVVEIHLAWEEWVVNLVDVHQEVSVLVEWTWMMMTFTIVVVEVAVVSLSVVNHENESMFPHCTKM